MQNDDRDAMYPEDRYDDVVREGTDTPRTSDSHKHRNEKSKKPEAHMGAVEGEVKPTKPPTEELANLTNPDGQATAPEDDDYNPADEITPG
jgi:hypothetical protein